jgi:hypothetical protein
MEWKHLGLSRKKTFKVTPSTVKVLAIILWDLLGVFLLDILQHGHTFNASRHCIMLKSLQESIRRRHPGLLSDGVILIRDGAVLHVAQQTLNLLQKLNWESGLSAYSLYLAPSDFHWFPALKENVSEHCFTCVEDVRHATIMWLVEQIHTVYLSRIDKLTTHTL